MGVVGVIPVMRVTDLDAALRFYVDVLGFAESFRFGEPPAYAGVNAGGHELHINLEREHAGRGEFYLAVDDGIDELYARVQERGATIDIELKDQPYGMRDFSVRDPDGNFLTLGQTLPESG